MIERKMPVKIGKKLPQRKTIRLGYTIPFTDSRISARDLLRVYRGKGTVEKAFSHLKHHLEPFFSRSEGGTRARLFLTVIGHTTVAIIAAKCGISYNQALKTMSGMRGGCVFGWLTFPCRIHK